LLVKQKLSTRTFSLVKAARKHVDEIDPRSSGLYYSPKGKKTSKDLVCLATFDVNQVNLYVVLSDVDAFLYNSSSSYKNFSF